MLGAQELISQALEGTANDSCSSFPEKKKQPQASARGQRGNHAQLELVRDSLCPLSLLL